MTNTSISADLVSSKTARSRIIAPRFAGAPDPNASAGRLAVA